MSFQKTVLNVALFIYCIFLIIVGILMYNSRGNINFPPDIGKCPDYWQVNEDGSCQNTNSKFNLGNLGETECESKSFNDAKYFSVNGDVEKCKWAKSCDLTWDGITNNKTICDKK